jgi:hypothetical protein
MFIFHRSGLSLSRGSFMSSKEKKVPIFYREVDFALRLADLQFFFPFISLLFKVFKMGWFWADTTVPAIPHAPTSASPPVRLAILSTLYLIEN